MNNSEIDALLAKHESDTWSVNAMSRSEQIALPKGKIAITIDRNGEWFYQGESFKRPSMVVMLSQSLIKIENKYFLIAPEQRLEIRVEDCPFVTAQVVQSGDKERIEVRISNGDQFEIGPSHPLCLQNLPDSNQQIPIIKVRDNLCARFSRACYYQLAEWAFETSLDGAQSVCVKSNDHCYSIGVSS